MATERKNGGKATQQKYEKNGPEYRNLGTTGIESELNKRQEELEKQNGEKEATITALRIEIDNLKSKVADQEETIEDLTEDRDEGWDEVRKLKLELADAWNITLETDAEKIREVARLRRDNKAKKSYCAAAKEAITNTQIPNTNTQYEPAKDLNTNEGKRSTETATDSGIDIQSLEKLIDERVAHTLDANHANKHTGGIKKNSSNEFTQMVYTNTGALDNIKITPATIDDMRELNVIVHGIKEDCSGPVKELFDTMEIEQHPGISTDRLGAKSPDKIRPIRITMESYERKQKFMSSLWRLKNGPEKFRRISVTEDYTQEERHEIKRWVDEAKRRTQEVDDGYVWKVRGSPRSKLRLVNMRK